VSTLLKLLVVLMWHCYEGLAGCMPAVILPAVMTATVSVKTITTQMILGMLNTPGLCVSDAGRCGKAGI
jgi:hypothetical protein